MNKILIILSLTAFLGFGCNRSGEKSSEKRDTGMQQEEQSRGETMGPDSSMGSGSVIDTETETEMDTSSGSGTLDTMNKEESGKQEQ
jgi:hypothetical protein